MPESIAAVVVTYNRKLMLGECLNALLKQTRPLDAIYVIDNASTDGTPEFLQERGFLRENKIRYQRLRENTGGAGGFHEGMKCAYNDGHDWLWVMDDDAEPNLRALEEALAGQDQPNVAAIASRKVGLAGEADDRIQDFIGSRDAAFPVLSTATFVGLLIKASAIKKIGLPRREFFMHHDDTEFAIRLRGYGKILFSPKSIVLHKDAPRRPAVVKFLGREYIRYDISLFCFHYFRHRNLILTKKHHTRNPFSLYSWIVLRFTRLALRVFLIDRDHRCARLRVITKAYCDGLRSNFDNDFPKRFVTNFQRSETANPGPSNANLDGGQNRIKTN